MTDSTPDRPHALLSDADLDAAIDAAFQTQMASRSRANSRRYGELLDERNFRADLDLPW